MKKHFISLLILLQLITFYQSFSQVKFQKTFGIGGGSATCIQQTSDGGIIITGFADTTGTSNYDVLLLKMDSTGNVIWSKKFDIEGDDGGRFVRQTDDGGYIVTGFTNGSSLMFLLKADGSGNFVWLKRFGNSGNPEGESVVQTFDGGYFMSGDASNYICLIRTDANGDTIWTKIYGGTNGYRAYSIQQTTDTGFIVCGYVSGAGVSNDIYLLKLNAAGDSLWSKTFGGTGNDQGKSVIQTNDDGYVVTGKVSGIGAGSDDVFLLKTDDSGNLLWSKTYGGFTYDLGYCVNKTIDGGYVIAGETVSFGSGDGDVILLKTDMDGNTEWTKTYGGPLSDGAKSVIQSADEGYIISGYSSSFTPGIQNVYIIKTDVNGNSGCHEGTLFMGANAMMPDTGYADFILSAGITISTDSVSINSGISEDPVCFTAAVKEFDFIDSITVYPNPFTNKIVLKNTDADGMIIIFTPSGQKVLFQNACMNSTEINADNLVPGIYFLNYLHRNEIKNFKLLK